MKQFAKIVKIKKRLKQKISISTVKNAISWLKKGNSSKTFNCCQQLCTFAKFGMGLNMTIYIFNMKVKLLTLIICMILFESVSAQKKVDSTVVEYDNVVKQRVVTNMFNANWFVGAAIGGQMYDGDHNKQMKFMDRWSPAVDLTLGKWFTPGIGVRAGISGFKFVGVSGWTGHDPSHNHPDEGLYNYEGFVTNAVWCNCDNPRIINGDIYGKEESGAYDLFKTEIKYYQLRADVMFNIRNMVKGFNPQRIYSIIPYLGVGWMQTTNIGWTLNPTTGRMVGGKSHDVNATVGLLNTFRLSDPVDFTFDVRGNYVNDEFDKQIGGRWGEGSLSATIGLTYKLGKRDWDRPKTKVVTYTYRDGGNAELLAKIKELEAANLSLREQLENNKQGEPTIDTKLVAAKQLTVFIINRSDLSKAARVNLGFLAKVMNLQSNTSAKYVITGYADRFTGTDAINVRLSRARAQAVYNCLVNEFGVDPTRLTIEWEGGVRNMFYDDPRLSRAVVVRAADDAPVK
jgi:outer membrane protein OmpA-like peptidoglycan-associated protein